MATETKIARVAFMDRGVYSGVTEYNKWDFVTTEDSTYLYIGESSAIGKPVTDTAYWKCIADGKQATEAADLANEVATHPAIIQNGTWHYWDTTLQTYVDSEIAATAYELYLQTTTDDPPKSESEYALYPITQGDYAKGIGEGLEAAIEATEEVAANSLVDLRKELDALKEIVNNVVKTYAQIETLSVDTLQINGAPLFLFGTTAPAVVPDFKGQIFIKTTAAEAVWIAIGDSTIGNWKEV